MHTKDKLAEALREANLPKMAEKAAEGYYHDFLSPLDMPAIQLTEDLKAIGTPEAMAMIDRHMNGEFDASAEESDEWANSNNGQEALAQLIQSFGDPNTFEGQYNALLHAMQTGVSLTEPNISNKDKHMRVGVNHALVLCGVITTVLIEKGVVEKGEMEARMLNGLQAEIERYKQAISQMYNTPVEQINLV